MIKALARHPAQAVALAASMNDEELRYYAASQLFLKETP
jgi:hypothetical protein